MNLKLTEQLIRFDGQAYERYDSDLCIETDVFNKIIQSMGGYIYNTCVGKLGDALIFNGFRWISVTAKSFGDCKNYINLFTNTYLEEAA